MLFGRFNIMWKIMPDKKLTIVPIQSLPTAVYKIGRGDSIRLCYGADLDAGDLLVLGIKAAHRDPKLIAEAVERFLDQDQKESWTP
jgi:hypothetical protein